MRPESNTTGTALATLAAALFLAAPVSAAEADRATGHCVGVNACKGQSSCKGPKNSCQGRNSCKGQGFVELTKPQCDQVGGSFEPVEKKS
jgi:uncharacterized membrane protein